jgi:hypothetical protein
LLPGIQQVSGTLVLVAMQTLWMPFGFSRVHAFGHG